MNTVSTTYTQPIQRYQPVTAVGLYQKQQAVSQGAQANDSISISQEAKIAAEHYSKSGIKSQLMNDLPSGFPSDVQQQMEAAANDPSISDEQFASLHMRLVMVPAIEANMIYDDQNNAVGNNYGTTKAINPFEGEGFDMAGHIARQKREALEQGKSDLLSMLNRFFG